MLVGLLAVIQARIGNGELALVVGSGIEAAVASFGSGLLLIVVIVLSVPSARAGTRRLAHAARVPPKVPIWTFLGGLGGATFVAAQGLVVPTTGVALFTIAIVAGLSGNSLVADKYGIGPGAGARSRGRVLWPPWWPCSGWGWRCPANSAGVRWLWTAGSGDVRGRHGGGPAGS